MTSRTTIAEQKLASSAEAFIRQCYSELALSEQETMRRIAEVREQIRLTGTYRHTGEELKHGARMAWRNSNRCIGRLFWQSLTVFDARHALSADEYSEAVFRHIGYATNGGKIRPAITVFSPERKLRIWNHQLIRYAGYEQPDGTMIGDSHSAAFTQVCKRYGWQPQPSPSPFDVLPLVIGEPGGTPKLYPLPRELVLEVPLVHPEKERFAELGLRWYAVPFIADMALVIGGIRYSCAPFNGWYMGTEIGARNLADEHRYNMLRPVAKLFGLDLSTNTSLWKDRALIELNTAVLYSYKRAGVSIVDHHTAAEQFATFEKQERQAGRGITGRWSWLIPPMSPSTTAIWHRGFDNTEYDPNFVHQQPSYEVP
ncbi:nitric oxide synthase oxygenase [Paenibacillus xylaniclasticus]|uniref:nitric oxide synthase oxygenase n=1 Tax=Paenibacillus xylaniclasticus TaxID=588083 RepID=UPI000FDA1C6C|nr:MULTISPECIES: nitric oxide synthase oxygenase [Paenibacillus]GFN31782.1 nitric oxide synthase oxygenase [Paenibacillus curdlanolyticus]